MNTYAERFHGSHTVFIPTPNEVGAIQGQETRTIDPVINHIRELLAVKKHVAVAIGGGSAVGKTSLFLPILKDHFSSVVISEDDYCVGNSVSSTIHNGIPNLHVPEDYEPALLAEHIAALKAGRPIQKPVYSYAARERVGMIQIEPARVIIVEGQFLLNPPLSDQFDAKIFIDTDDHSRFMRRMIRPRRNPKQTDVARVREYVDYSFPYYYSHILPTKQQADFVIANRYHPREANERISFEESDILFEEGTINEVFSILYPYAEKRKFSRTYYYNLNFLDDEILYLSSKEDGEQTLVYSVNQKQIKPGLFKKQIVFFDVGKTELDLEDIGYTPIGSITGVEFTVTDENHRYTFVQLPDNSLVLQVSEAIQKTAPSVLDYPNNIFAKSGIHSKGNTLDGWLLERARPTVRKAKPLSYTYL